jgi:hypothetical protein
MYQGIFDTDFDKYTEDAVTLFGATGISTVFENLEGFPRRVPLRERRREAQGGVLEHARPDAMIPTRALSIKRLRPQIKHEANDKQGNCHARCDRSDGDRAPLRRCLQQGGRKGDGRANCRPSWLFRSTSISSTICFTSCGTELDDNDAAQDHRCCTRGMKVE